MHAEYKVPGGKLVVVDLDVEAGRLANVRLAGDFFLEPDTALDDIDAVDPAIAPSTAVTLALVSPLASASACASTRRWTIE